MVGLKVELTRSMAKWYLDHPEYFMCPGDLTIKDIDYDTIVQMSLLTLLGEQVIGTIIGYNGCNEPKVEFKTKFGCYAAYYRPRIDVRRLK